jgi:hypothetical protein
VHIVEGPYVTDPSGSPINIEVESLESTILQPGQKIVAPASWNFPNPAPNSSSCNFDVVVDPQGQYVVAVNVGNYLSFTSTQPTGGFFLETAGVPAVGGIALIVLIAGVAGTAVYFMVRRRRLTANS